MSNGTATISPRKLRDHFLGVVDTSRLQRWAEAGVFGKRMKRQGAGRVGRAYGMRDVVLAVLVRDVLELTRSHTLDIALGEDLRGSVDDALRGVPAFLEGKEQWLRIAWDAHPPNDFEGAWNPAEHQRHWHVSRFAAGDYPFTGTDAACIVLVNLSRIIAEVRQRFDAVVSA